MLELVDGAALIVAGDVSGKGLKAAMTGTPAIAALRTLVAEGLSSTKLVTRLNRQITTARHGGFITCLCARMSPDGPMMTANAGHLSPCPQRRRTHSPARIALRFTTGSEYSETTLGLVSGDTLTFLSGHVVEAQNAAGDLFGFERTREISTMSVEEIANTAQAHGQQDEITVPSIRYAPAIALHA